MPEPVDLAGGAGIDTRLGPLLARALTDEPPVGDAVDEIFRQADWLHRRRSRHVVAAAAVVVAVVIAIGYGLTAVLLPDAVSRSGTTSGTVPPRRPDPVRAVFLPAMTASGLRILPREPYRGDGWRQYSVLAARGRPHGLIEVSVYDTPGRLCFPVLTRSAACARPEQASSTVEYARYSFERNVNWQVNQVIARRVTDGRTVVVQATGERGTGTANGGRPPLTALLTARFAADPRLLAAFNDRESCSGPDPTCPLLRVPLPTR
jgi:hypothetical protein